ncbi:Acriflavin resistance protein, partial [mine drainage metagenome]
MREEHLPPKEAARKAMRQITGAIVAITLVLAAVFIPSALQTGSTGVIYRQFALTLSISMVFSAFLAMSFSPALCASLMHPKRLDNALFRGFNRLFESTRAAYVRRVFHSVTHLPRWMTAFAVVVALGLFVLAKLPGSFVPEEDQGDIMASIQLPPGASLQRTEATLHRFYELMIKNPAVHDVFQVAGSGFAGTAESAGRAFIHLVPWSQRKQTAFQVIRWGNSQVKKQIHNASVFLVNKPTIQGLGQFGGFDFYLEDRAGLGRPALNSAVRTLLGKARKDPELYDVRV